MQRSIPCRRAVTAFLAALVLAIATTPVVVPGASATSSAPRSYYCPPLC
jgi:hypothetical protein